MPRRIAYSQAAAVDIVNIRWWYRQPGAGRLAKERVRRISDAIRRLRFDPVIWPRGEIPGTRERVVEGHTVVYAVDPDTNDALTAGDIMILRVFGPGQSRRV
jgi:plasmid stabilization system protein ParE